MKSVKLKVYLVCYAIKGGLYVPPDPCVGGDYYSDVNKSTFITCSSAMKARKIVKTSYPQVVVRSVTVAGEA